MKDPLAYINAIKEILNETDNVDDIGPGPNNRSKIPRLNVMPNKMPNNSNLEERGSGIFIDPRGLQDGKIPLPAQEFDDGGRIGFSEGYGPFEIKQGPEKGKFKLKFTSANPEGEAMYFNSETEAQNYLDTRDEKLKKLKIKREYNLEREKASKYLFKGKKYKDLTTDEKQKVRTRIAATGKFTAKKAKDPLTNRQQALILKEFPDADFTINKYGFTRGDGKYEKVARFVKRGYKLRFFKPLSKPLQRAIVENFPEYKNFNFKTNLYGVPSGQGASMKLYDRIRTFVDDPKPFQFAFNLRSPEGWTMAQMYRAGDDKYEPIRNENEKITGFKDKTGKSVRTYNIDNINKHPDFPEIQKYYNVAELSRTPVSKYENVAKLLPKGFDPDKILLNDLLQFIADKDGLTGINRAKRAIEIHHTMGVKNKATGNFQLLSSDKNKLADIIEQQIKKGNLDRAAELEVNKIRIETGGQKFGSRKVSPKGDFKQIISGVEQSLKDPKFNFKQLNQVLLNFCPRAKKSIGSSVTKCTPQEAANNMKKKLVELKQGKLPIDEANKVSVNLNKVAKVGARVGTKGALATLGPLGIGGDFFIEGMIVANDYLGGMPGKEAWYRNWMSIPFGGGTDKADALQMERIAGTEPAANRYKTAMENYNKLMKLYDKQSEVGEGQLDPFDLTSPGAYNIEDALKAEDDVMDQTKSIIKQREKGEDIFNILKQGSPEQQAFERRAEVENAKRFQIGLDQDPFARGVIERRSNISPALTKSYAGGGLAKLAGERFGKPPEAGPTPQGLAYILKRDR